MNIFHTFINFPSLQELKKYNLFLLLLFVRCNVEPENHVTSIERRRGILLLGNLS